MLMMACEEEVQKDYIIVAQSLLAHGADPNIQSNVSFYIIVEYDLLLLSQGHYYDRPG